MSLTTGEAGWQEEYVHREAGLFLPRINSYFFGQGPEGKCCLELPLPCVTPSLRYTFLALHLPSTGCLRSLPLTLTIRSKNTQSFLHWPNLHASPGILLPAWKSWQVPQVEAPRCAASPAAGECLKRNQTPSCFPLPFQKVVEDEPDSLPLRHGHCAQLE